ncbi:MAG: hypothetical protein WC943_11550 [Elusimicrobiota bacterium]|jgi:hypothetical protein
MDLKNRTLKLAKAALAVIVFAAVSTASFAQAPAASPWKISPASSPRPSPFPAFPRSRAS